MAKKWRQRKVDLPPPPRAPIKSVVEEDDLDPTYPWEKQPDESAKAYQGFSAYRDLDPLERSLRAVGQKLGKYHSQISGWASPRKHDWLRRVKLWDKHLDELKLMKREREILSMTERHANSAVAVIAAAMTALKPYIKTDNNPDPPKMKTRDAIRLFDVGVKVERQARGEPDSVVHQTGEVEVNVRGIDEKRKSMLQLLEHPEGAKHLAALSKLMGTDGGHGEE